MESEKQGVLSVDTTSSSSEENDDQRSEGQVVNRSDESGGAKRSYECTYCKRGFTNAQALGGHMNIHRKDRAKAKQHTSTSANTTAVSSNYNTHEAEIAYPFAPSPFSTPYQQPPSAAEAHHQRSYSNSTYFQPSTYGGTNYGSDYYYYNQFGSRSSMNESLAMNEELLGANLSLRMTSSSHLDDREARRGSLMRNNSDEVDLELRLGHGHE